MGSSSDWPDTPWLRNQARMDREDEARGVKPWFEDEWLKERQAARAASRRHRFLTADDYETPIASEQEPQENRW